jgi:hypothetical protein
MAAGTQSKVRLYEPTSERVKKSAMFKDLQKDGPGFVNTLHLYEVEYTAAFSNGLAEMSIPSAVFDGTSVSVPLALVSDDNTQDKLAGLAAKKVSIIELDVDGLPANSEQSMSGTTAVLIDDFPERLDHMYVSSVGSEGDAKGNITLARRGYHEVATPDDITAATETGLTANTIYYFKLNINGAGVIEYYITVTTASCTFATLLTLLAAAKKVSDDSTISGVTWSVVGGDLRCTSNSALDTAAIAITAGTTGNDLLASLTDFSSMDTAVGSGYQELGLTGITGATETGLVPQKEYFFKIALDGGAITEYYITATTAAVTYTQLLSLLNSAILETDDVTVISGVTFTLESGDVRATSTSTLDTAAVSLTAGTSGTDLFGASGLNCTPDTAVGSGYQECGFTGKLAGTDTGLIPNTKYYYKLNINGAGVVEYYITVTLAATTITQLIALLNASKKVSDDSAISGVTWALVADDIRCTSNSTATTSAIAITAGTSGTDLLTTLSSTPDTEVQSGYQGLGLTGKTTGTDSGIIPNEKYYFKVNIDSAGILEYYITVTDAVTTYDELVVLLNNAKAVVGDAPISGVTFALTGGNIIATSDLRTAASAIAITAGTSGTDLLSADGINVTVDAANYVGYQECGLSGKETENLTGLLASSQYYFKVAPDGGAAVEYDITTTTNLSFTSIIALLNTATTGVATWSLTGGDLRCTSDQTTVGAKILLTAGTTGDDLFAQLTDFSAVETEIYIGQQGMGLSGISGGTTSGLDPATETMYYKIDIDSAGSAEESISVVAGSTLFSDLITSMNAGIAGATWGISGGDFVCTSAATTSDAKITLSITALSGTSLFEEMTGFTTLPAEGGTAYQELGLSGLTGGTDSGIAASAETMYYKVNIDGAGEGEESIVVTAGATLFSDIITLLNAGITGATFAINNGDLRLTSSATTSAAAIALSVATLSGTSLFEGMTGFSAFETAVGTGSQEFGLTGKVGGDATGLTATTTYYYKVAIDGAGAAEKNFNVIYGATTYTDIMTALNASLTGAVWSITGGDLRLTSSTNASTSAITLSYAALSGTSFIESLTGFTALDAAGGIGYQEFGLTGKTSTTETGLTADHSYYFKVALDGAGAAEYHIHITTTSDTTYAGVVALMNTAITAINAEFSYPDQKLRCTSELGTATSAIALTAGTTGDDLFAALTGWTAFDSAVAYELYLTIAAGANESDGMALWMPSGYNMWVPSAELTVMTYAAAAHRLTAKIARTNFDGDGSTPDFSYELVSATVEDPTIQLTFPETYTADAGGKVMFYETYIAAAETGFFKAVLAIYDPSNTGRGID